MVCPLFYRRIHHPFHGKQEEVRGVRRGSELGLPRYVYSMGNSSDGARNLHRRFRRNPVDHSRSDLQGKANSKKGQKETEKESGEEIGLGNRAAMHMAALFVCKRQGIRTISKIRKPLHSMRDRRSCTQGRGFSKRDL